MSIIKHIIDWFKSLASDKQKALQVAKEVVNEAKVITGSTVLTAFVNATPTQVDNVALAALIKALNWADLKIDEIDNQDAKTIILNAIAAGVAKYSNEGISIQEGLSSMPVVYKEDLLKD